MTPTQRIDLKLILQRTVSAVYGDLVTRPTGRKVRVGIEQRLRESDGDQVAVIDFATVRCLDLSCADEVVGKLLLHYGQARYFLLSGLTADHLEAIEPVLERHRIAVVAVDREGRVQILGPIQDTARRAFAVLWERGRVRTDDIAEQLRVPRDQAREALDVLLAHHVVQPAADGAAAFSAP